MKVYSDETCFPHTKITEPEEEFILHGQPSKMSRKMALILAEIGHPVLETNGSVIQRDPPELTRVFNLVEKLNDRINSKVLPERRKQ